MWKWGNVTWSVVPYVCPQLVSLLLLIYVFNDSFFAFILDGVLKCGPKPSAVEGKQWAKLSKTFESILYSIGFNTWNKTTSKSYSGNSLLWIGQLHTSHAPWAGVEEHTEAIETTCKKHSFANLAYLNGVGITEIKNLKHLDICRTFVIVSSQNYCSSQRSILHLPCSWLQFCSYAMFYQHFSGSWKATAEISCL